MVLLVSTGVYQACGPQNQPIAKVATFAVAKYQSDPIRTNTLKLKPLIKNNGANGPTSDFFVGAAELACIEAAEVAFSCPVKSKGSGHETSLKLRL